MVDFHTHILPGIDDGARNVEESFSMLEALKNDGIALICLTPHFYSYMKELDCFLDEREKSYLKIKEHAEKLGLKLFLASEAYMTDSLFNIPDLTELCINKKFLLTELPYTALTFDLVVSQLDKLMLNKNVIPILAHIDRYPSIFNDEKRMDYLIDMGCIMQLNLYSIEESFLKKNKILKYIKNEKIHSFGTDCHNMVNRMPKHKVYYDIILKKLGDVCLAKIYNNSIDILGLE